MTTEDIQVIYVTTDTNLEQLTQTHMIIFIEDGVKKSNTIHCTINADDRNMVNSMAVLLMEEGNDAK
jgi:hypothetical protein